MLLFIGKIGQSVRRIRGRGPFSRTPVRLVSVKTIFATIFFPTNFCSSKACGAHNPGYLKLQ
ncbi:hypothetical protein COCOBI_pt-1620 (chloroplast) [Coccomyxa sp. Obi]|nr:hypothetical protein COCOBI_pt-1620 [Coccomyxa sp. Obi]